MEADEQSRQYRQAAPVAGFGLTFSPQKSVSIAWALSDQGTNAVIYECHRRAIDYILALTERNIFHSRSGKDGVVHEDVWVSPCQVPVFWAYGNGTSDHDWRRVGSCRYRWPPYAR
jgi:hypothetical protein